VIGLVTIWRGVSIEPPAAMTNLIAAMTARLARSAGT
jgi:hypothetical protein